jgi:large subunit ribosomal protein L6e
MADTAPNVAAKPVPAASKAPAKGAGAEKKKRGIPRNYDLGNGVYRFSRSRMYHKKALYKFIGKKTEKKVKCIKLE